MENDLYPTGRVEYDEPSYLRYTEDMDGCRRLFLGMLVFISFIGGIAVFALFLHFFH